MDDTQAQAQNPAADEQTVTSPTIPPNGNGSSDAQPSPASMHEADSISTADLSSIEAGMEVQPSTIAEPHGGTAGNEPPIATALSGSSHDLSATQDEATSAVAAVEASPALDEFSATKEEAASTVADVQASRAADEIGVSATDVAAPADAGETTSEEPWRPADVAAETATAAQDTSTPTDTKPDSPEATSAPSASGGETMEELMSMYGQQSFKTLKYGDVIEGRIMRVGKDELLVDIGAKSEGIVPSNELSDLSPTEYGELKEGDEILVSVVTPEDNEGHAVLSLNRARQEKSWRKLQRQFDAGEIIQTEVSGYNKGGLLANLDGVRGFVPSSQVTGLGGSDQAKQADLQAMVGRQIGLKIIEINRNRNRLILSERLALTAQREVMKERLLSELKSGDTRHGRVVSIADFGAFVDIGGADGLIHLSELSWSRVNHPSEVLKVGQEVDVYVLGVDEQDRKIALSLKRTQQEPWMDITTRYQVGQLVEGTITQLATFGAFARIADGVEGLIHVSELSEGRIMHPRDAVHEGEHHTLRIIRIDPQRKRIGLSLKRAVEGANMDDILAEGQAGGERSERGPRPERSGEPRGERSVGEPRGERSSEPRGERSGSDRGERRDRGERGGVAPRDRGADRRPREAQIPSQTTFGGGGQSAMELAMREAMAQRTESEDTNETPEIQASRSAMNTVDVTINTNTPPPSLPHISEPESANAEAIDQVTAPTAAQDDEVAAQVASIMSVPESDNQEASEAPAELRSPASSEAGSEAPAELRSTASSETETHVSSENNKPDRDVTPGEDFAASGSTVLSTLEANEAEEREVSTNTADAAHPSGTTTYPNQGENDSDATIEETGTGSEASSQHGETDTDEAAGSGNGGDSK